jgi:hypothetical protein
MISYLMVKTHSKTGLKYLCKTTQDPFKYKGSGKYWRLHLEKHGAEHHTEIIKECCSNTELKDFGRYYSKLWNVVESDDWANLKPEEGDGGSNKGHTKSQSSVEKRSGENHPRRKNPEKWDDAILSLKDRDMWWMKGDNHPMKNKEILEKISGENHYTKSNPEKLPAKNPEVLKQWRQNRKGAKHSMFDHQKYSFKNKITGEVVSMTRYEFYEKFDFKNQMGNISEMISGKRKSVKGWRLL